MLAAAPENLGVIIEDLGLIDYRTARELQLSYIRELVLGNAPERIIFCSHPPTITLGSSAKREDVYLSDQELASLEIALEESERGGEVTYHSPDQLIIYPILDLNNYWRDVGWYLRLLERSIMLTLADLNLRSYQINGKTGVWVDCDGEAAKIASIGVKLSRWRSMHGAALNLKKNTISGFSFINPCGLGRVRITAVEELIGFVPDLDLLKQSLSYHLCDLLKQARKRV
ncbi:MAG TPA: lipoyl(octanoyl) transferase LipB [Oligoflexia bacterium]|nr:lipoyl(octanoyl) transferase LipB [Oligoflexia bacterium]HMP27596.1 lipoyl(octanoyl) transferase LipB [Oligoflexia bacterium]